MEKALNSDIKILYIEDDDIARENGVEYLENYFDKIYEAPDAITALTLYTEHKPDIIITDIQMPKLSGLEFVKRIRQKDKKTQIIIISAYNNTEYLLQAVELQLIKYLIKPIDEQALYKALELCIESIHGELSNIIELSQSSYYDRYNQTLVSNGKIVKLRTKEIALLTLLLQNKNRYVNYSEIENVIWYDSVMTKDALKTLVKNLKAKLPKNLISNLTGTGYKIEL